MVKNYKRKKKLNRKFRGYASRYKPGFRALGSTNKFYHAKVPRTLQIATRRYNTQMLRFVKNYTYKVVPQLGNPVVGPENCFIQIRANSIYDLNNGLHGNGSVNMPNTWTPQDSSYGTGVTETNAEGYSDWKDRYQHFTVLGSRLQATCQSLVGTSAAEPATFYVNLAGATGSIAPSTQAAAIMNLPYTKRARIFPAVSQQPSGSSNVPGARLALNYSTKTFEGVNDVMDNQNLRGQMDNSFHTAAVPSEQSFFTVGYVPTMPFSASSGAHAPAIITIKVEYIVKLTEPTDSNQVSA